MSSLMNGLLMPPQDRGKLFAATLRLMQLVLTDVGFMALHNQTTGTTKLDMPSAHRHEVIGSKKVIIGCGGKFHHECASKYTGRPMDVGSGSYFT